MDWVYLALSVNGAIYTVNAYKPVKKNPLFFPWSFFASWITIELAWVHLVWQVAFTTYFVRKGALRSGKGKVAFLVNLASFAGPGLIIYRSLGARHEVRDVLTQGHGFPVGVCRGVRDAIIHKPGDSGSWTSR
jgi:hypothetical protein